MAGDAELLEIGRQVDAMTPDVRRLHDIQQERLRAATAMFEAAFPNRAALSHEKQAKLMVARELFEMQTGAYEPDCDYCGAATRLNAVEAKALDIRATTLDGLRVKLAIAVSVFSPDTDEVEVCDLLLDLAAFLNLLEGRPWLAGDVQAIADNLVKQRERLARIKRD